jgi:LPXTG-motif cell wall-anchored protein
MWGPSVNENTSFTFDISDPDDPNNEATASVAVVDGNVVITATNFHYSGPTLSVRATSTTPSLPATGTDTIQLWLAVALIGVGLVVRSKRRPA